MTAATVNFICEEGSDWSRTLELQQPDGDPVNLTGCSARMQVRTKIDGAVVVELSSANGRIEIDGEAGKISLALGHATTFAALDELIRRTVSEDAGTDDSGMPVIVTATGPTGVYDLEITDSNGLVTRYISGFFCLSREVTK